MMLFENSLSRRILQRPHAFPFHCIHFSWGKARVRLSISSVLHARAARSPTPTAALRENFPFSLALPLSRPEEKRKIRKFTFPLKRMLSLRLSTANSTREKIESCFESACLWIQIGNKGVKAPVERSQLKNYFHLVIGSCESFCCGKVERFVRRTERKSEPCQWIKGRAAKSF